MILNDHAASLAKQARMTRILTALASAADGRTFLSWVTQSGEAERHAFAVAVEPLLAEAEAKAQPQGATP